MSILTKRDKALLGEEKFSNISGYFELIMGIIREFSRLGKNREISRQAVYLPFNGRITVPFRVIEEESKVIYEITSKTQSVDKVGVLLKEEEQSIYFYSKNKLIDCICFPLKTIDDMALLINNQDTLSELSDMLEKHSLSNVRAIIDYHLVLAEELIAEEEQIYKNLKDIYRNLLEEQVVSEFSIAVKIPINGKIVKEIILYQDPKLVNLLNEPLLEKEVHVLLTLKLYEKELYYPLTTGSFSGDVISSVMRILEKLSATQDIELVSENTSKIASNLVVLAGMLEIYNYIHKDSPPIINEIK